VKCALCMYVRKHARKAETIINGSATCMTHAGYLSGGNWSIALMSLKRDVKESTGGHELEDWDIE
jgi:hypothetical protein